MSETYKIACKKCGVSFWVGQASGDRRANGYLYTEDNAVFKFLFDHSGHDLLFYAGEGEGVEAATEEVTFDKGTGAFIGDEMYNLRTVEMPRAIQFLARLLAMFIDETLTRGIEFLEAPLLNPMRDIAGNLRELHYPNGQVREWSWKGRVFLSQNLLNCREFKVAKFALGETITEGQYRIAQNYVRFGFSKETPRELAETRVIEAAIKVAIFEAQNRNEAMEIVNDLAAAKTVRL